MDNSTIKEISDVVTKEVMKQVQSNLSDMKPELLRTVTEAAARKAIEATDAKYRGLEERIVQLEAELKKRPAVSPALAQPEAERTSAKAVDGINTLSMEQIDDILSFPNFCREANGWIYYIKIIGDGYDEYGELYKVRPDGTENQKIFNGKVSPNEMYAKHDFKVSGGKLSFIDEENRDRVIRV